MPSHLPHSTCGASLMAMSPARKPRAVLLRERLEAVSAELEELEQSEYTDIFQTARENEENYIHAKENREAFLKHVMNLPKDQRPPTAKLTEVTGLSRQRLEQIRDGK